MANTLTNLMPDLYEALDIVSREQVGFIPSVLIDGSLAERAAKDQTIRSFVAPQSTASDITPGLYAPDNGDQTFTNKSITISKSRYVPIRWNGEEQKGMNSGPGYTNLRANQMAQAFRTLCNEIETDLAALHIYASRAYGTAGTTPFASDLSATAQVRKILADNGAPMGELNMVIDSAAGAKMRTLTQLTKANEAADTTMLRQGVLLDVHGFAIRESAKVKQAVTVGTGASATTNNAGYSVGDTVLTLASAGTGTIIAGDIITITGDASGEKYVVVSGDADVSNGGTITIAAPGLRGALSAATHAITVVAAAARNVAFDRNAIVLLTRPPALPQEGDMADDRFLMQDPRSGLTFEVSIYKQYRQVKYELAIAWGCSVMKPEHVALLLG
jgi:hypothetical protein